MGWMIALDVIEKLNSLSPLGLAGALAYIIYLLVKNKKAVKVVSTNHLSGLPDMELNIAKLVVLAEGQGRLLEAINANLIYIRARVNGSDR